MSDESSAVEVAEAVLAGVSQLVRRVRRLPAEGELTMPERTALARLDRDGPATSAELAREAQISPQSMGATLSGLVQRGLLDRGRDPGDGRRVVLSTTKEGRRLLRAKRNTRSQQVAQALSNEFTRAELRQLMVAAPLLERLGRTL